jgi:hypothetical protein
MNRAPTATLLFLHNRFYQLFDAPGAPAGAALAFSRARPLV